MADMFNNEESPDKSVIGCLLLMVFTFLSLIVRVKVRASVGRKWKPDESCNSDSDLLMTPFPTLIQTEVALGTAPIPT